MLYSRFTSNICQEYQDDCDDAQQAGILLLVASHRQHEQQCYEASGVLISFVSFVPASFDNLLQAGNLDRVHNNISCIVYFPAACCSVALKLLCMFLSVDHNHQGHCYSLLPGSQQCRHEHAVYTDVNGIQACMHSFAA